MGKAKQLRKLVERKGSILVPGVYDALSAKIAERVGFEVIFHTGYGTAASLLAQPDVGLVSFGEMVGRVASICRAVKVPVICDADTGYGNAVNVYRTVKEYIWAGASGMIVEDQVWPKRCGHMTGKETIPHEESLGKIRAAVDARDEVDSDVIIIARTDAIATEGLQEAIDRAKEFKKAGADIIFLEAPKSYEQLGEISKQIDTPMLLNQIERGATPLLPFDRAEQLGFKIVLYPLTSLYAAAKGIRDSLEYLKKKKTSEGFQNNLIPFGDFNKLVGYDEFHDLEMRYVPRKSQRSK